MISFGELVALCAFSVVAVDTLVKLYEKMNEKRGD